MNETQSVLFALPLIRVDEFRESVMADRDSDQHHESHHLFGITREMVWIQRRPSFMLVRWEGNDVFGAIEQLGTSTDPFWAKWRGFLRIYVGPVAMENFWQASSLRKVFSWTTGRHGPQTDARVLPLAGPVNDYLRFLEDVNDQDELMSAFDRIRRGQGITAVEVWHHHLGDEDVMLRVVEGEDLDAAFADIDQGHHDLDRRLRDFERAISNEGRITRSDAELIVDWRA